jgi:two-component system, chemotaxis family, response regulator Rcp1
LILKDWEEARHSVSPFRESRELGSGESQNLRVLLAEDNRGDVILVKEALASSELDVNLLVYRDGEEMMDAVDRIDRGDDPSPSLILLDLNLPKRDGIQLLRRVRQSPNCGSVPVVIVTSSAAPQDRKSASLLGANEYFQKPSDYDKFMQLGDVVRTLLRSNGTI